MIYWVGDLVSGSQYSDGGIWYGVGPDRCEGNMDSGAAPTYLELKRLCLDQRRSLAGAAAIIDTLCKYIHNKGLAVPINDLFDIYGMAYEDEGNK